MLATHTNKVSRLEPIKNNKKKKSVHGCSRIMKYCTIILDHVEPCSSTFRRSFTVCKMTQSHNCVSISYTVEVVTIYCSSSIPCVTTANALPASTFSSSHWTLDQSVVGCIARRAERFSDSCPTVNDAVLYSLTPQFPPVKPLFYCNTTYDQFVYLLYVYLSKIINI